MYCNSRQGGEGAGFDEVIVCVNMLNLSSSTDPVPLQDQYGNKSFISQMKSGKMNGFGLEFDND